MMDESEPIHTAGAKPYGPYPPKTSGSPQPLPGRCGAKLRRTDGLDGPGTARYCRQYPMRGRTRCRRCGGKTPRGPDHPRTKYAYLPPAVLARFEESLADQRLTDLRPDIALLEILKQEAAAGLDVGVSLARWQAACEAFVAMEHAPTDAAALAAKIRLGEALAAGTGAAEAREETAHAIERRGKLVRTYQQLQVETEDLVSTKRVGLVLALIAGLVREFIDDERRRREFSQRFVGLLSPRLRPTETSSIDAVQTKASA